MLAGRWQVAYWPTHSSGAVIADGSTLAESLDALEASLLAKSEASYALIQEVRKAREQVSAERHHG